MKRFDVVFRPEARSDHRSIYFWIADRSSDATALRFIDMIEDSCSRLSRFPERGTRRDDIAPGLRIFGINRRVTIAFRVDDATVTILHVLYGGRDLEGVFPRD